MKGLNIEETMVKIYKWPHQCWHQIEFLHKDIIKEETNERYKGKNVDWTWLNFLGFDLLV